MLGIASQKPRFMRHSPQRENHCHWTLKSVAKTIAKSMMR
jgi:hypothetical protein